MATTTSDKRVVRVSITNAELAALLGAKAQESGLINFTPDTVECINNGNNWEVVFEVTTV